MAKPLTPDQTIAALKKWGVRYKEYPGWRTRTRPGGLTEVAGVGNHHTGGGSASDTYLHFLFVEGRPKDGIPGPLCNVATDTDGVVHLGAAGRANHFGSGSQRTLDHARAEDYAGYRSELSPGPDGVNGNPLFYGNEWIYSGTKPPSAAQYAAAVRYNAAICDAHGWTALSCIAHREWTNRKNDPFGVVMNKFRLDVAALLKAGPKPAADVTPKPPASTEDDMPLTTADLDAVQARAYKANSDYAIAFWVNPSGTGTAIRNLLAEMKLQLDRIEDDTDGAAATQALLEEIDANVEALKAEALQEPPKA